jgi:hypothetical protein
MMSGAKVRLESGVLIRQRIHVEKDFVLSQRFNSGNDRAGARLEQVSAGAGIFGLLDHPVDRVLAEDQYFSIRHRFLDLRRGTQAIHVGHADVHDYYIRPKVFGLRDGFDAIAGCPYNAPTLMRIQQALEGGANGFFIIND